MRGLGPLPPRAAALRPRGRRTWNALSSASFSTPSCGGVEGSEERRGGRTLPIGAPRLPVARSAAPAAAVPRRPPPPRPQRRALSLSQSRKMRLRALAHSGRSAWPSGSYSGAMGCTTAGGGAGVGAGAEGRVAASRAAGARGRRPRAACGPRRPGAAAGPPRRRTRFERVVEDLPHKLQLARGALHARLDLRVRLDDGQHRLRGGPGSSRPATDRACAAGGLLMQRRCAAQGLPWRSASHRRRRRLPAPSPQSASARARTSCSERSAGRTSDLQPTSMTGTCTPRRRSSGIQCEATRRSVAGRSMEKQSTMTDASCMDCVGGCSRGAVRRLRQKQRRPSCTADTVGEGEVQAHSLLLNRRRQSVAVRQRRRRRLAAPGTLAPARPPGTPAPAPACPRAWTTCP